MRMDGTGNGDEYSCNDFDDSFFFFFSVYTIIMRIDHSLPYIASWTPVLRTLER